MSHGSRNTHTQLRIRRGKIPRSSHHKISHRGIGICDVIAHANFGDHRFRHFGVVRSNFRLSIAWLSLQHYGTTVPPWLISEYRPGDSIEFLVHCLRLYFYSAKISFITFIFLFILMLLVQQMNLNLC